MILALKAIGLLLLTYIAIEVGSRIVGTVQRRRLEARVKKRLLNPPGSPYAWPKSKGYYGSDGEWIDRRSGHDRRGSR